jgi:hypothetical protein
VRFVGKGNLDPNANRVYVVGGADRVCGDARESVVPGDARVCVRKAVRSVCMMK